MRIRHVLLLGLITITNYSVKAHEIEIGIRPGSRRPTSVTVVQLSRFGEHPLTANGGRTQLSETEETKKLSTSDLEKLVSLEQLRVDQVRGSGKNPLAQRREGTRFPETEETKQFSTADLERLVLLKQLEVLRLTKENLSKEAEYSEIYNKEKEECTTRHGDRGECLPIDDCASISAIVEKSDIDDYEYLEQSDCESDSTNHPLVCCGKDRDFKSILPDRSVCGYQDTDKVLTTVLQATEFPWLVLLEYTNASGERTFECGGALISARYVLTAAHCVVTTAPKLLSVRLGEWNLDTAEDCTSYETCIPPPEDIRIEQIIPHPGYHRDNQGAVYNDIALIRLVKPATQNEFVRPICLPLQRSKPGERLYIAGWGARTTTRYSPVKQKLGVPVIEPSECSSKFGQLMANITTKQICAGGEEGKDSCIGDSGGPLMATSENDPSQYYVEGIASYGRACGTYGWPDVYTRVTEYLDWITQNVKP